MSNVPKISGDEKKKLPVVTQKTDSTDKKVRGVWDSICIFFNKIWLFLGFVKFDDKFIQKWSYDVEALKEMAPWAGKKNLQVNLDRVEQTVSVSTPEQLFERCEQKIEQTNKVIERGKVRYKKTKVEMIKDCLMFFSKELLEKNNGIYKYKSFFFRAFKLLIQKRNGIILCKKLTEKEKKSIIEAYQKNICDILGKIEIVDFVRECCTIENLGLLVDDIKEMQEKALQKSNVQAAVLFNFLLQKEKYMQKNDAFLAVFNPGNETSIFNKQYLKELNKNSKFPLNYRYIFSFLRFEFILQKETKEDEGFFFKKTLKAYVNCLFEVVSLWKEQFKDNRSDISQYRGLEKLLKNDVNNKEVVKQLEGVVANLLYCSCRESEHKKKKKMYELACSLLFRNLLDVKYKDMEVIINIYSKMQFEQKQKTGDVNLQNTLKNLKSTIITITEDINFKFGKKFLPSFLKQTTFGKLLDLYETQKKSFKTSEDASLLYDLWCFFQQQKDDFDAGISLSYEKDMCITFKNLILKQNNNKEGIEIREKLITNWIEMLNYSNIDDLSMFVPEKGSHSTAFSVVPIDKKEWNEKVTDSIEYNFTKTEIAKIRKETGIDQIVKEDDDEEIIKL